MNILLCILIPLDLVDEYIKQADEAGVTRLYVTESLLTRCAKFFFVAGSEVHFSLTEAQTMQPIFFVIGVAVLCEAVAAGHRNESAAHSCSNGTVCHGLEKHCWESGVSRCEVLAKVTSDGASGVLVDLMSHANGEKLHLNFTNRWIGLGFSLSGKMPNAAVVHCFNDDNNTVQAKLTFNVPDRHFNTGWKDIDQSPLEVQVAKLENDELHCVVKLHKIFKIKESTFDLNKPHKLLVATGPLKNGTISRHDRMPAISDKEASF